MRRFPRFILAAALCAASMTAVRCVEDDEGQMGSLSDASAVAPCATCPTDAGSSMPPVNATPAEIARCASLSPSVCAGDPGCVVMYGLSYDKAQHCRAAGLVPVGCRALGAGCGGTYTLATDPGGGAWRLGDICLPPGWQHPPAEPQPARWVEDFPVCPSSQVEAQCARLTNEVACKFDTACYAVTGVRLNESRRCKEASVQFVGCTQNKGCNGLSSLARDAASALWELPGVCMPLGWTLLANTESNSQRHDWPACR